MPTPGRDPATSNENCTPTDYDDALQLMERALVLIDRPDGPLDVGAHLDLAISRLKEWNKLRSA